MDDTETQTDGGLRLAAPAFPALPVLTIVHHPDAARIGRRCVVPAKGSLVLGRQATMFGEGALDDALVSRRHVEVTLAAGRARASDLGSHNGTLLNGQPITTADLAPGDVLGAGRVLVLYHLGPATHEPASHPVIAGVGAAVGELLAQVALVAKRPTPVLILGETGTGKELVARELHRQSGRPGALVAVNCGALSDGVVHSELFGHARGAFSGADRDRTGLVAAAQGGTLFLDEVGDATPALQASLLRLLEQREYRPVGSERALSSDARFVAATHVDLATASQAGRFRRDLLARLDRWAIRVPALRDRPEDIVPLAMLFAARVVGHDVRLSRHLALALLRHTWPMNVRELMAVMEQAALSSQGQESLQLTDAVAERLRSAGGRARPGAPAAPPEEPKARGERPSADALRARLAAHDGNMRALAKELGCGRNTLYRWMKEAGIDPGAVREGL